MASRRQRGFEVGPLVLAFLFTACGGKTLEVTNDSTAAPGSGNQSFGGAVPAENASTTGGASASQGFACPAVPSEPCKPGEEWNVGVCRCVDLDASVGGDCPIQPNVDVLCDAGQEFDPVACGCVRSVTTDARDARDEPYRDAGCLPGTTPIFRNPGCGSAATEECAGPEYFNSVFDGGCTQDIGTYCACDGTSLSNCYAYLLKPWRYAGACERREADE
jgi:hypothetical protein